MNEEVHTCMRLQLEAVSYKSVLAAWTNLNLSASSTTRASRNISYAVFPSASRSSAGLCSSGCTSMELEMEASAVVVEVVSAQLRMLQA
jgi:hypothetical protein